VILISGSSGGIARGSFKFRLWRQRPASVVPAAGPTPCGMIFRRGPAQSASCRRRPPRRISLLLQPPRPDRYCTAVVGVEFDLFPKSTRSVVVIIQAGVGQAEVVPCVFLVGFLSRDCFSNYYDAQDPQFYYMVTYSSTTENSEPLLISNKSVAFSMLRLSSC